MNKKYFSFLVFTIGMFFLNIPFVVAKENIEINDISVVEHSENITIDELVFEDNKVLSNISFNEVNDFVTFNLEIKNNTNINYVLESINNNIQDDYLLIESSDINNTIKSNSITNIKIRITYKNEIINSEDINLSNVFLRLSFKDPTVLVNPLTGSGTVRIFLTGSFLLALTAFTLRKKKKYLLLLLLFLIPTFVFALDNYNMDLIFDDINIKGRYLDYNITINNGTELNQISRTYGEPIGELPNIVEIEGYTTIGWVDQNDQVVTSETIVTNDLVLAPKYEVIKYNITYDFDGGTLSKQNPSKYTVEDEITLNNPTKAGYTFAGWSSDGETYQTSYTIAKGTTGDLYISASFSANQDTVYTVIHRKMNMSGNYEETEREELHGATDTPVSPQTRTYTGFTAPARQTKNINGDGSTTFTYDYSRNRYTFTVTDRTYLTQNSTANGEYYYGTQISVTATQRAGYTFKWNDNSTNLTKEFTLSSDTTLTPIYTANTNTLYTVIHKQMNMDGETYTVADTQELHGTTGAQVEPATITYEGFTAPQKQTVTINGNGSTVVEYLYTRNRYTLTIEDPDYVETETPSGEYYYGTSITLTAKNKTGYIFTNWSNNSAENPTTFTLRNNTTIGPVYLSDGTIIVTLNPNGGNVESNTIYIEEDNPIGELPVPERENYMFQGWYISLDSAIEISEDYIPDGNIEIVAKWKKSIALAEVNNSPISILVGENETLTITNTDELGESYTISSEDESIATVTSAGLVTAIARGETNIVLTGTTTNLVRKIHVYVSITNEAVITFKTNGGKFVDKTTENVVTYIDITKYSHTSNVDDTGKKLSNYGSYWNNSNITGTDRGDTSKAHVVTIPGATKLIIDIYYNGESTSYDWATIWSGSRPTNTAYNNYSSSISGASKLGGAQTGTYTVNGNLLTSMGHSTFNVSGSTATFGFRSDSGGYGNGYGYYAIIRGLGIEGTYKEPVKGNTIFMGWYKELNNSNQQPVSDIGASLGDITLYAKYGYKVTYNANGGTVDPSTSMIFEESSIGNLPTPTRSGFSFAGWYTSLTGGIRIDENYILNNSIILYARWEELTGCTYEGELIQGAEYVQGQYTYRYMQEAAEESGWADIDEDGWGVVLTDKNSKEPVTSPLCSSINNKPIVSTKYMFKGALTNSIDTSSFDTSNVTNMSYMFQGCSNITELDLRTFDTENVTNFAAMFLSCGKISKINLESFNTQNATNLNSMFSGCSELEELDLTGFNTTNVTSMSDMFDLCGNLKVIYATNNFTTNALTLISTMFYNDYKLVGGQGTKYNSSQLSSIYAHLDEGEENPGYFSTRGTIRVDFEPNGGTVTFKTHYYNNGDKLGSLPIPTRSEYLFDGWYTDETHGTRIDENTIVTEDKTYYAHWIKHSLKTITFDQNGGKGENIIREVYDDEPIGELPTAIKDNYVFEGWFTAIEGGVEILPSTYITSSTIVYAHWSEGLSCTFDGELVKGAEYIDGQYKYRYKQHYSTSGWQDMEEDGWGVTIAQYNYEVIDTAPCTMINDKPLLSMQYMFGSSAAQTIDVSGFNTHNIIDMSYMFSSAYNVKELDLSSLDTSNVKNMSYMFRYASYLDTINMSNFDFSSTTNLSNVFDGLSTYNFKQLIMDNIDANDLVSDFGYIKGGMFANATIPYASLKNWKIPKKFEHWLGRTWAGKNVEIIDVSGWDLSNTKSILGLFADAVALVKIDGIETWKNTSGIEDMSQLFYGLKNLEYYNINNLDTSGVINISLLFYECEKLTSIDLSGLNTSNVIIINSMFAGCKNLQSLNMDGWNLSNIGSTSAGGGMLSGIPIKYLSAKNWILPKKFEHWLTRIWGGQNIETVDVTGWNLNNTKSLNGLFGDCIKLKTIIGLNTWDTSKIENMSGMFNNCILLENLDLRNFDTSNVTDMSVMFSNCTNLNEINIISFDTRKVTNMANIFTLDTNLKTIYASNKFVTSAIPSTDNSSLFGGDTNLVGGRGTAYNSSHAGKDYAHLDGGSANPGYFTEIESITVTFNPNGGSMMNTEKNVNPNSEIGELPIPEMDRYTFNGWYTDIQSGTRIDEHTIISNQTTYYAHWLEGIRCTYDGDLYPGVEYVNGQYTYRYMQEGTQGYGWADIDENGWGVVLTDKTSTDYVTSKLCTTINDIPIVSMAWMFYNTGAQVIDTSSFNTSNVKRMNSMFWSSNGPTKLDVSMFDTSNVTTMDYMFENSRSYELDVSNFNTSKVTSMMYMFAYAKKVRELDLSSFDTSNVTSMMSMFDSVESIRELDLSSFHTPNVVDMTNMFEYSTSLERVKLDNFDTSNVSNMFAMFRSTKIKKLDLSHFDTSSLDGMGSMFQGTSSLKELDISTWITSKLTDMSYAFGGIGVEKLDLRNFDTHNVTDMKSLFSGSLTKEIDIRNWDTSNVTDMSSIFSSCKNLEKIYASDTFNTQNISSTAALFSNSTNLVGGAGTTYNSNNTTKTYARIDQGSSAPGYFTGSAEQGSIQLVFNPNVEGMTSKTTYANVNEKIGYIPYFDRTGYRISGWYKNPNGTEKITTKTIVTGPQTYYAQWEQLESYTVTLDPNGGTVSQSTKVLYVPKLGTNIHIGALPTPTRSGYTFQGWYTGLTDGYSMSTSAYINKDTTLYARWSTSVAKLIYYGSTINTRMKIVSGNSSSNITSSTQNSYIKSIVYTNTLKSGFSSTTNNTLSSTDSKYPIYIWWDSSTKTIFMYCASDTIYTDTNISDYFREMRALESLPVLEHIDTSNAMTCASTFENAGYNVSTFNIDVSNLNVSKCSTTPKMFKNAGYNATNWSIGNLSNWDTKAYNMQSMFEGAGYNATNWSIGDLSNWNLNSAYQLQNMFKDAGYNSTTWNSIGTLNLGTNNKRTPFLDSMFENCPGATATINLYRNPTSYKNAFTGASTKSGSQITINYDRSVNTIDKIIAEKSSDSNIVKGNLLVQS